MSNDPMAGCEENFCTAQITIYINGKEHVVGHNEISFEELCKLAKQPDYSDVLYLGPRHGDSQRSGSLVKGQSVTLEPCMQFEVGPTTNA